MPTYAVDLILCLKSQIFKVDKDISAWEALCRISARKYQGMLFVEATVIATYDGEQTKQNSLLDNAIDDDEEEERG